MSQVIIEFGRAMAPQAGRATDAPISDPFPQAEEVTSGLTSAATTMTAKAHDTATIINNGTDAIWVQFGTAPTASVGNDVFLAPNTQRDFGPLGVGMKAAVINDS